MKLPKLTLAFVLIIFANVTCAESKLAPVKIAGLIHLTGEYPQAGKAFEEGMRLAEEEVNQAGGILERPLKVILSDTQYNMKTVNTLAHKAISIDKVPVAIISNYTEVMVAGSVFEKAKIPLITLWDSSPEIEALGDHVFGIGVWAPSTSQVAVDYARKKLQAKTAIIIATNGQWSLAVANSFTKQFREAGGTIVKEFTVNPGDTDFRAIATRIARENPDVIYAPLSDHQIPFWKQIETSGYSGSKITSDILNQEILRELGAVSEGILQTQVADPQSASTQKMLDSFKRKYGRECEQIFLTALGYDGVHLAAQALRKAQAITPSEISKQLYLIQDYPGAAGRTSISKEGSARKAASMFVVKGGKLLLVEK